MNFDPVSVVVDSCCLIVEVIEVAGLLKPLKAAAIVIVQIAIVVVEYRALDIKHYRTFNIEHCSTYRTC